MPSPARFESPANWIGSELFEREDWKFQFGDDHVQELKTALQQVAALPLEQITPQNFSLPNLSKQLAYQQDRLENGSGACLLNGFAVDQFNQDELKRIFWGISSYIGTPVSQSATGERIFSVRNEGFAENDPRSRGPNTKKKLSFHTDRCDVIGFMCLQPAKSGGENYVVSSIAIYNEILQQRPDLLQILMQPFYYKRHNVDQGNAKPFIQQPIFSIHEGNFAANLLRVLIDRAYALPEIPDLTDEQKEALDLVETLADDPKMHASFRQEAGDLVFLNNFVTLHRRSEFEDHDEIERRRHLLRIWLSVPNSRELHPLFAGNYGATNAGAIRGGMHPAS